MIVCTREQMRKIDSDAESVGGIPSIVLMENAAISCLDEPHIKSSNSIGIICGKGNNAGDGFALARHLLLDGKSVTVYLVCGDDFTGDCLINHEILQNMGAKIIEAEDDEITALHFQTHDVLVDAIFGTGVHGEVSGIAADVIRLINSIKTYTVSVDVPSGMNCNTGQICGVCVKADATITFAAYKTGMLLFPASDYVGDVIVKHISIPKHIIDSQHIMKYVLDEKSIQKMKPIRQNNTHKGSYGKVLVIAGSTGMTGAAYLSSQASLVTGSGIVTLATPKSLNQILETKLTEVMTSPLDDNNGSLCDNATTQIISMIPQYDAILFGPGLGRGKDIVQILRTLLKKSTVPVIIDADGLYALSQNLSMLDDCVCDVIITPHSGEMARLIKCSSEDVEKNRLHICEQFAYDYGVTVVLKGYHTIVTGQDSVQYINITGNCGMATAGSGDVLAGMITSFAGRGVDTIHAAALGVYLHGMAGDIAKSHVGENSLTAHKILDYICKVL